jgi:hypothetical protein
MFLGVGGSSEAAVSGRAAPRLPCYLAQKDGCAQRTGAHARPKPTSICHNDLVYSIQGMEEPGEQCTVVFALIVTVSCVCV